MEIFVLLTLCLDFGAHLIHVSVSSPSPWPHLFLITSGSGKGGISIWGRKFEDEYSEYLKVIF